MTAQICAHCGWHASRCSALATGAACCSLCSHAPAERVCDAPGCGEPLDLHIGGKPCVVSTRRRPAERLSDLAIFEWAWREDGRDRRA
jgi:hypothetical protein